MKYCWRATSLVMALLSIFISTIPSKTGSVAAIPQISIYDLQYTDDPSGDSPYSGQAVTVTGIVTGVFVNGYFLAEGNGPWQAVYVYTNRHGPLVGDQVTVSGTVQEYYGLTEVTDISTYQHISSGHTPIPLVVDIAELPREQYESVLVQVQDVTVTSLEDFGEWVISAGGDAIQCDDMNDYVYFPQVGDHLDAVTGNLTYSFGEYKIEPRETNDISGDPIPHYALGGHIVTMNETREVLENGYIEILGDEITAIHTSPPSDLQTVSTGGLIYPGLIDAHNHPVYNVLDTIPFPELFTDRYEWQRDPLYASFKDQFNAIKDFGGSDFQETNLFKLAEIRALTAGTTMIQGVNANGHEYDGFARQGIVVDNAERFPNRVYDSIFPLREPISFWQIKQSEYWQRFLVHLSEGTHQAALDEFYTWLDMGMLDGRTTIIHGIPLGSTEWQAMAKVGASLVWSPASNLQLYNATADIPTALQAGVNVALAPDWTESGSLNILDELKVAEHLNQSVWHGSISPLQFAEFVTRNAARALGIQDRSGQIAPGYQADLMVIPGDPGSPYHALLESNPADVQLTIVNGLPLYGDPDLMEKFPIKNQSEDITVDGVTKQLAVQVDSHAIPEAGRPYSEIIYELKLAYDASQPRICDFLGIDQVMHDLTFLPLVMWGKLPSSFP